MCNRAAKTATLSLPCVWAALHVGHSSWGIPARPSSRNTTFALSYLHTSKSIQSATRKLVYVANRAQARYKGGYSDPQALAVTPTLSLGKLGNASVGMWVNLHRSLLVQNNNAVQPWQTDSTRQPHRHEGFPKEFSDGTKTEWCYIFLQTRKRKMLCKKSLLHSKYSHNQQQYIILNQKDLQGMVMNFSPDRRAIHSYMTLTLTMYVS